MTRFKQPINLEEVGRKAMEMSKIIKLKLWKDKNIYYLDDYKQYWVYDNNGNKHKNPNFRENKSGYILKFKNCEEEGLKHYTKKLINVFSYSEEFKNEDYLITFVPSHKKNNVNSNMINLLTCIEKEFDHIKYKNCLERKNDIEKLSDGGNRKINIHLNSIEVIGHKNLYKEQKIILFDDVTSTGNSLLACKELLENLGAKVTCIALSKTLERKSYEQECCEMRALEEEFAIERCNSFNFMLDSYDELHDGDFLENGDMYIDYTCR